MTREEIRQQEKNEIKHTAGCHCVSSITFAAVGAQAEPTGLILLTILAIVDKYQIFGRSLFSVINNNRLIVCH